MDDILASIDAHLALFAFAFVILDVVSGVAKGIAKRSLSSKKMKTGFWNKTTLLFIVFLAGIVEYATVTGFNIGFNMPIFEAVCAYVSLMEVVSIVENLAEINPSLRDSRISNFFAIEKKEEQKEEQKEEKEEEQ